MLNVTAINVIAPGNSNPSEASPITHQIGDIGSANGIAISGGHIILILSS